MLSPAATRNPARPRLRMPARLCFTEASRIRTSQPPDMTCPRPHSAPAAADLLIKRSQSSALPRAYENTMRCSGLPYQHTEENFRTRRLIVPFTVGSENSKCDLHLRPHPRAGDANLKFPRRRVGYQPRGHLPARDRRVRLTLASRHHRYAPMRGPHRRRRVARVAAEGLTARRDPGLHWRTLPILLGDPLGHIARAMECEVPDSRVGTQPIKDRRSRQRRVRHDQMRNGLR